MSDQNGEWPSDPDLYYAPQATLSPLVEPTEWREWDEAGALALPVETAGESANESAKNDAGAPRPVADESDGDDEHGAHGVHGVQALRALLLGGESREYAPRLADIERRLEALDVRAASGTGDARLAAAEQRIAALAAPIEEAQAAARGADVTLNGLAALQRQVEDLRLDHLHLAGDMVERLRDADERCRLRQRRARSASRLELQQLRRRVYARAQASAAAAEERAASEPPVWPLAEADEAAATDGAGEGNDHTALALEAGAGMSPGGLTEAEGLDAATAWRALRRSAAAFVHALVALIVALAHLAADDVRSAAQHIRDVFTR
jgi:hypothetical protein